MIISFTYYDILLVSPVSLLVLSLLDRVRSLDYFKHVLLLLFRLNESSLSLGPFAYLSFFFAHLAPWPVRNRSAC